MSYSRHTANVPLSILDGSDGELVVEFDWSPGTPESGRFGGPPENYDPGSEDEFIVQAANYTDLEGEPIHGVAVFLADHEAERVVDWLYENWTRPDDGPDPDDQRDALADERMEARGHD